jgi:hypothetical protein
MKKFIAITALALLSLSASASFALGSIAPSIDRTLHLTLINHSQNAITIHRVFNNHQDNPSINNNNLAPGASTLITVTDKAARDDALTTIISGVEKKNQSPFELRVVDNSKFHTGHPFEAPLLLSGDHLQVQLVSSTRNPINDPIGLMFSAGTIVINNAP